MKRVTGLKCGGPSAGSPAYAVLPQQRASVAPGIDCVGRLANEKILKLIW